MRMSPELTVLMTMYAKTQPSDLDEALESLWSQTVQACSVVLVIDGPIGEELAQVVDRHERAHTELTVIRLPENCGSGKASQQGLSHVHTQWCARLDSDDIAVPERFEKQLAVAEKAERAGQPLDVIGTAMTEFASESEFGSTGNAIVDLGTRTLPENHDEIVRYARINSPVNNPAAMFRTERVKAVGGYRHRPYMEDYDLWARLIADGARFCNLAEPLTRFRVDGMLTRRRSKGIFDAEKDMQQTLVELGLISAPRGVVNLFLRTAFRLLPTELLARAYRAIFIR